MPEEASADQLRENCHLLAAGIPRIVPGIESACGVARQVSIAVGPEKVIQESVLPENELVVVECTHQLGALVANITGLDNCFPANVMLQAECPLLQVRSAKVWIDREYCRERIQ